MTAAFSPNRAWRFGEHVMLTDGRAAVMRPFDASETHDPPITKPPSGAPEGAARGWLKMGGIAQPLAPLLALVRSPECSTCAGSGDTSCRTCAGTGNAWHTCSHCSDTHQCVCRDCDTGRVACKCDDRRLIVVCGVPVLLRLLGGVLRFAGFDPAHPVLASAVEAEHGPVMFRQGDTAAFIIGRRCDEADLKGASRWP